jgi:hypothetical protein
MPTKAKPTVERPEVVTPPADISDARVLEAYQKRLDAIDPGNSIIGPNSARVPIEPQSVQANYSYNNVTQMLGSPEKILLDPKPTTGPNAWAYLWRKRNDPKTMAMKRSGIIRPVEVEEIDVQNPVAEFILDVTPEGSYVSWENLGLFEMAPKWVKAIYGAAFNDAVNRVRANQGEIEDRIRSMSRGTVKGKATLTG